MHVAQVNYVYEPALHEPEALLDRFPTLGGWSEALLATGAARATVAQRFGRDAELVRRGVEYRLASFGGGMACRHLDHGTSVSDCSLPVKWR